MKNRLLVILVLFSITFSSQKILGQDPQFTQFYSVPLYLSPSLAGATQQQRFAFTYRQQWVSLPGSFGTYVASYDHYYPKFNSGFGFLFMRDQAGSANLGTTYASLLYSYDIVLFNVWHVRPGLSFVYDMYSIDFSKLRFSDQITGINDITTSSVTFSPSYENKSTIDGSASTIVYNHKTWMGITVDHLLMPNSSFYGDKVPESLKYTIFGGTKLVNIGRLLKPSNESVSLAFQLQLQQNYRQMDVGVYWNNLPLVLGLWYRGLPGLNSQRGDALSFLVGAKRWGWNIGYSYDFTISNLIGSTAGAHELSVIYEFSTNHRRRKIHAIPCPEF